MRGTLLSILWGREWLYTAPKIIGRDGIRPNELGLDITSLVL